jgi:hypothetical protein
MKGGRAPFLKVSGRDGWRRREEPLLVWEADPAMTAEGDASQARLLRRGFALEYATLCWNVAGVVVLALAALSARSVALAGFGLDSLIEIGASAVVIWELSGTGEIRQRRALRLIAGAFAALAVYLVIQSTWALTSGHRAGHSPAGIIWTAITAVAMFGLAAGKSRVGTALGSPRVRDFLKRSRPLCSGASALACRVAFSRVAFW